MKEVHDNQYIISKIIKTMEASEENITGIVEILGKCTKEISSLNKRVKELEGK